MVSALKRCSSAGRRHGMALSRPMTRLRLIATMSAMRGAGGAMVRLDGDRRLDRRVRIVAGQLEILVAECEQIGYVRTKVHRRQSPRLAPQLFARLLQMVQVKMRVTECVD